jgi:hypothetical protein
MQRALDVGSKADYQRGLTFGTALQRHRFRVTRAETSYLACRLNIRVARRMAVTIDHLLIGADALLILAIGICLIKLRAVNLRLRVLQTQIGEMHILTSRLLLRELNVKGDFQAGRVPEEASHKGDSTSDDPSPRRPTEGYRAREP